MKDRGDIQKVRTYDEVFQQKHLKPENLVKSYRGIMVGNPSPDDIRALASFEARAELGENLSEDEEKQASSLAIKFKGSFC